MLGEESSYAIQMNRYFLKPIGIWPVGEDASGLVKTLRDANVVACFWLICFLLVPCALHTFLEEPNPNIKLKLIGPMSFCLMALAKYCSLVGYIPEIAACFEHVEQDWTMYRRTNSQYELRTMRRNAKIGRKLALLCAAFMYGGGFFYHTIMPLSSGKIATTEFTQRLLELLSENNTDLEHMGHGPRALTYPIYARLLNVERSPVYEIVFAVQTVSGFVLYTITIGACSLAATFVVHVCAQLQIVMDLLGNLADGTIEDGGGGGLGVDVEARLNDKIATIVERHLRALTFAERVENNLNVICFVEFIGCTMNICFLGYYFITEWESRNTISTMTYCILLVSFTFNIFIFCYIGEILTEQRTMDRLSGKVAVVTGASAGIGLAIAKELLRQGMTVVGLARRKSLMEERLGGGIIKSGEFRAIECDVSKEESVKEAFQQIERDLGALHVLINNAGIFRLNSLADADIKDIREQIDVNVLGLVHCSREAIRIMKDKDLEGHIVNMNSIQGHRVHTVPGLNFNVYSATKHAVTAITETLQKELLGGKIRVTSISPGVVKSEIFEETNVDKSEYSHYPTLNSSDVAEAVAFIVSRPQHVQITEMTIRPLGELI
ncbi:uncharacterized protein LOC106657151 isoform X3 [Trichogramma pretiosum]|uniref:uncharacterized protein LOC106657151 isoform X3 n=1 Tax=Trichogramma pretiosum TaxID=7493 RepID=UPI000C71C317|nr:uncharacterized protein LOC106657151 isoform X3 [Trichogramma pretiosum]